jgi:hypothetical protein
MNSLIKKCAPELLYTCMFRQDGKADKRRQQGWRRAAGLWLRVLVLVEDNHKYFSYIAPHKLVDHFPKVNTSLMVKSMQRGLFCTSTFEVEAEGCLGRV